MLTEDQLIDIARKVAARLRKSGTKVSFPDLVNEAYLHAAEHQRSEAYAAFWAYKKTAELAFNTHRKYTGDKTKEVLYYRVNLKPNIPVENIIDLLSVLSCNTCNITMQERLYLYHHFVEEQSIKQIADYYHREHSGIARTIRNAKNKLKLLLS